MHYPVSNALCPYLPIEFRVPGDNSDSLEVPEPPHSLCKRFPKPRISREKMALSPLVLGVNIRAKVQKELDDPGPIVPRSQVERRGLESWA